MGRGEQERGVGGELRRVHSHSLEFWDWALSEEYCGCILLQCSLLHQDRKEQEYEYDVDEGCRHTHFRRPEKKQSSALSGRLPSLLLPCHVQVVVRVCENR